MPSYLNPILPGSHPDPSIVRHGSSYFLCTSSFEYTPGLPIYHSKDLITWELISHALTRRSQLDIRTPEIGGGVWAPTLRIHDGWFYVAAASFDRYRPQADERTWPRGFYVKCRVEDIWDREGKGWSECVWFDEVGFDQDLFFDDDGSVYLSTTRRMQKRTPVTPPIKDFAIHINKIDIETGNSLSAPVVIRSSKSGVAEGSHIFKRGKYYYLFTAEGGTESGHCEWVSRSENGPLGPWEIGSGPLWEHGEEVVNTGHVDIVEGENGNWWAVMLGVRPLKVEGGWKPSVFGRETFLVPMAWENDWPVINGGKSIKLEAEGPGLYLKEDDLHWRDDFKGSLKLGWYRKNTAQKQDFFLVDDSPRLRLKGSPYTLSSPASPTLLLRKQMSRTGHWSTLLSFHPTNSTSEAGTAVYWNYLTYSSIGIRSSSEDPSRRVVKFKPAGDGEERTKILNTDGPVQLFIRCEDESYKFGFSELEDTENTEITWIGEVSIETMTIDPPVGAAFTGMMLGLYAFGDGEPCLEPADFGFAEWL